MRPTTCAAASLVAVFIFASMSSTAAQQVAQASSLPRYPSACGRLMPRPTTQPPQSSEPLALAVEFCYSDQADTLTPHGVAFSTEVPLAIMKEIQIRRFVSSPSTNKWVPYSSEVRQVMQEDMARLNRLASVQRASSETLDYIFTNGVVGKTIIYRIIERN